MKQKSIWMDYKQKETRPSLKENLNVDVLIIGGGMTGISNAYHLSDSNLKIALVEKNTIGMGVTSKTTGKLTYLQENLYSKIRLYHGVDKAKLYIKSQKDAISIVTEIIKKHNIDCDLEKANSYLFSGRNIDKLKKEVSLLKKDNIKTYKLGNKNNNCYVTDTYVFHPLKYLYKLKEICINKGISIYENTKIISIKKDDNLYICITNNNYIIKAKYVVLALHYPYFLLPFLMPFKCHLEKSYIEAYPVSDNYKFSSITISKPVLSTRFHTSNNINYKLVLNNSHNYCVKNNEGKNFSNLLKTKNNTPLYLWSNKDIITHDYFPFIGLVDDNLLIGTGYNTWGMTNGSLAGKIISDIILGKPNEYINLFNPRRSINLGKILSFPTIIWSSAYAIIKNKVSKNKSWYSNRIIFYKKDGKSLATYTDVDGLKHTVYNLCPHMKCSLIFNEVEKTWDCPCHGSRFDIDGKCIEGPSNYDISYK